MNLSIHGSASQRGNLCSEPVHISGRRAYGEPSAMTLSQQTGRRPRPGPVPDPFERNTYMGVLERTSTMNDALVRCWTDE